MVVIAMTSAPSGGSAALAHFGPGPVHRLRGRLNGLDDVHVAGATAKVAFQATNLILGRVRVLVQEVRRGHDEAGRAVAALKTMLVPKSLLQRVQLPILGHALDRGELLAFSLDGEHGAALDGVSVHQDRACTALTGVAADVGPSEADYVSRIVHAQQPGLDPMLLPVALSGG